MARPPGTFGAPALPGSLGAPAPQRRTPAGSPISRRSNYRTFVPIGPPPPPRAREGYPGLQPSGARQRRSPVQHWASAGTHFCQPSGLTERLAAPLYHVPVSLAKIFFPGCARHALAEPASPGLSQDCPHSTSESPVLFSLLRSGRSGGLRGRERTQIRPRRLPTSKLRGPFSHVRDRGSSSSENRSRPMTRQSAAACVRMSTCNFVLRRLQTARAGPWSHCAQ